MGGLIGGDQCTRVFVVAKCWMGCVGQYQSLGTGNHFARCPLKGSYIKRRGACGPEIEPRGRAKSLNNKANFQINNSSIPDARPAVGSAEGKTVVQFPYIELSSMHPNLTHCDKSPALLNSTSLPLRQGHSTLDSTPRCSPRPFGPSF